MRHDLVLGDTSGYLEELCANHVSGHLKIAPEHVARSVTEYMRKPPVKVLEVAGGYATSKRWARSSIFCLTSSRGTQAAR